MEHQITLQVTELRYLAALVRKEISYREGLIAQLNEQELTDDFPAFLAVAEDNLARAQAIAQRLDEELGPWA